MPVLGGNGSGSGGASNFVGLTDTPAAFTGAAGKVAAVNVGETALEFIPAATGGSGGPVTYNPFQKRVAIPTAAQFATVSSTTGAAGSITDDTVNGLTVASTSGTEAARTIHTKTIRAGWEVIEFSMSSDQTGISYASNGLVLMSSTGQFATIGVGSSGAGLPAVRILLWGANGVYASAVQNGIAWTGWSAFFRIIKRGSTLLVYHSYDGSAWAYTGAINELTDLGGAAVHAGPSANNTTTTYVTYYADKDIVPQFSGFVGAGNPPAPTRPTGTALYTPPPSTGWVTVAGDGAVVFRGYDAALHRVTLTKASNTASSWYMQPVTAGADFTIIMTLHADHCIDLYGFGGVSVGNSVTGKRVTLGNFRQYGSYRQYFTGATFSSESATGINVVSYPRNGKFYMKLVRVGTALSAYFSADGLAWVDTTLAENIATGWLGGDIDQVGIYAQTSGMTSGTQESISLLGWDTVQQAELLV